MARFLFGAVKVAVYRIDKDAADFKELKKRFKLSKLDDGKPEMRMFPNDVTGDSKMSAMIEIPFDKAKKNLQPLYDEISAGMTSNI